ncbi:MAG: alpha-L-fucosidase [Planctomycetes bacterium]|nr:alpha-L-fucosidase [Planctomycetota bacterium]
MSSFRTSALVLLALTACTAIAAESAPHKQPDLLNAKPEIVKAWQDMRFGMFVCWGPVSLTGKEIGWSRGAPPWGLRPGVRGGKGPTPVEIYDNLYKKWKPDKFNVLEWVSLAKDAGAKYIIFLIKHHDGFCLFDTKQTDFKITGPESAWKVDVMKEIADACHKENIKLMIYYSQPDWHHPDYLTDNHTRYVEYLHGQIRELLTNYGRIDGLWFDNLRAVSPQAAKLWQAERLFKMARSIQPHLIINNRCGLPGDYDTPEQQVGRVQTERPWESCITLGTQWSWKPDDKLKPFTDGVRMLVVCAVGNGNLALNTNPMPDGCIEPRQVESFKNIGKWLKKYGESIYGTRGGPFVSPDPGSRRFGSARDHFKLPTGRWWGGSTHKGDIIYLHILRWPDDTITLPPIKHRIVEHAVLTGGRATVKQTSDRIELHVQPDYRDVLDTIVKLQLDGPASDIPIMKEFPSGSLACGKKAIASNVFQNSPEFKPSRAVDDDPDTRWGCDWGTHSAWLAVDLGKPMTFDSAWISEPYNRVRKFELQFKEGNLWQTFHRGTTIAQSRLIKFSPVTARHIRLNLTDTTEGPSIWEFQLFKANKKKESKL